MIGLGEKLRAARKAKRLRQQDVAEMLNLSRTAYVKYEEDKAEPSLPSFRLLAEIYGVTMEDLFP